MPVWIFLCLEKQGKITFGKKTSGAAEARKSRQRHSRQGERWEQRPGRKELFRNLLIKIIKKKKKEKKLPSKLPFSAELFQKWVTPLASKELAKLCNHSLERNSYRILSQ